MATIESYIYFLTNFLSIKFIAMQWVTLIVLSGEGLAHNYYYVYQ